jgi:hypothetical protein
MDANDIVGITASRLETPSLMKAIAWRRRIDVLISGALTIVFRTALGLGLSCIISASIAADVESQTEALDISRLAYFVEWPNDAFADSRSAIGLCLFSGDPLAALVTRAAAGLRDGSRRIVVRRIGESDAIVGCNILYLGAADSAGRRLARAVENRPVLIVSNSPIGSSIPAVIVFAIEGGHVCFDIDEDAAARNRLVISSKLLALARNVNSARSS